MDENVLKNIQNNYNDFQDTLTEINFQYDQSEKYWNRIIELFEPSPNERNNGNESASLSTSNSSSGKNGQILIKIKEPIESIKSIVEDVNNKLNKMNDLLEISKNTLNQINNLNDINLISNRGKSKSEISIVDLIEFMTMIFNNFEQDFQMKKTLFDDIKEYMDPSSNQLNPNLTTDKLNTTIPMWTLKPLENLKNSSYVSERLKLFNSILKLNK
ncbi:hypothetical protein DICPUDRAFT_78015 [Dictyostelium purpureum]|uniref:Uncharacterized protein n=1 Tax=Dictyostelium purpureum TaxID=5786 RepID=F0ZIB4_DICPU|nr:uncharacterized protein DICPUDRAFT_78015 [Dictyostelium purpureum]EGC36345.1 hypothetical protein DICPUDRAFT_78015 [Dictyostelium purpureum]|eukprot:XP_003287160.1 hypothetical protein DICPUDRAFT_78015 [Dictyostelium purpureum]